MICSNRDGCFLVLPSPVKKYAQGWQWGKYNIERLKSHQNLYIRKKGKAVEISINLSKSFKKSKFKPKTHTKKGKDIGRVVQKQYFCLKYTFLSSNYIYT